MSGSALAQAWRECQRAARRELQDLSGLGGETECLSDLREAMSAWVEEFSEEGEQGPFEEDVISLGDYLGKVVSLERDLDKAVAIVEWVMYLVGDQEMPDAQVREGWAKAVSTLQSGVQAAVKERGLPPVDFVAR